jgi:hypothetical protein
MRAVAFKGVLAAGLTVFVAVPTAIGVEKFIPNGHLYSPDNRPLPPLNSPADYINNRTDVYQSEIHRKEYERKMFDTEFYRYDLNPGPADGPQY